MNQEQFNALLATMNNLTLALQTQQKPNPHTPNNIPRIAVKIPKYEGKVGENVLVWILQIKTILTARRITDEQTQIQYASTGFEDAALY